MQAKLKHVVTDRINALAASLLTVCIPMLDFARPIVIRSLGL